MAYVLKNAGPNKRTWRTLIKVFYYALKLVYTPLFGLFGLYTKKRWVQEKTWCTLITVFDYSLKFVYTPPGALIGLYTEKR